MGNKEIVDFKFDEEYLQRNDKIFVPIQSGY